MNPVAAANAARPLKPPHYRRTLLLFSLASKLVTMILNVNTGQSRTVSFCWQSGGHGLHPTWRGNPCSSAPLLEKQRIVANAFRGRESSASSSASDLATYTLPHHSSLLASSSPSSQAPWLHAAIKESVRHLDDAPFFELVHLDKKRPDVGARFECYGVPEEASVAPEMWPSIAESMASELADVVIMVRHLPSMDEKEARRMEPERNVAEDSSLSNVNSLEEGILRGKVGECCDGVDRHEEAGGIEDIINRNHAEQSSDNLYGRNNLSSGTSASKAMVASGRSGIVRFSSGNGVGQARQNVKVRALPKSGVPSDQPLKGFWGVIIQSRNRSDVDGAYMLKAVRSIASSCSCTHFTLTKLHHGERIDTQFVKSWLV